MKVPFATTAFNRDRAASPDLQVVNMLAEPSQTEERGVILLSRPGLDELESLGTGPVKALFKADGVLGGKRFAVSGNSLYRDSTLLGAVSFTGPISMAGYSDNLLIAGGASLYGYDGTTLAAIAFPDGADVTKVVVGAARALCIREGTGDFYWSDVLSTTIDGLSFANAESKSDNLLDILFIDDMAVLFGSETVEFWPNTNDADLPFQPLEGRVFERGVRATGCATAFGPSFAWVTDLNQICFADQDNVISFPGLEERIIKSVDCSLWTFTVEGMEILALTLDNETWGYNRRTGFWTELRSVGYSNWLPVCFAGGVFGSGIDGRLLGFGDTYTDLGGDLERIFTAGQPLNSLGPFINNVVLRCQTGQTPYLSGDYANPVIEMRLSRDGGRTWGGHRQTTLGTQGDYRHLVQWVGCGQAARVGFFAQFRVTDPVGFRVSEVLVNEPFGGL
jgi:hypothetical protein